jgi:hypothetical protein
MWHVVNARQHLEAIRKMLPTLHSKTMGWAAGAAPKCKPPSEPLITRKDSAHFSPHLSRHALNSTLKSCPIWLSMPFPSQACILPESLDVHTANQQEKPQPSCGAYPSPKRDRKIKWMGATNGPTVFFGLYERALA